MKKNRSVQTSNDYSNVFTHAWQNEMNRCMFGGMLSSFEYGTEFAADMMVDDLTKPSEHIQDEKETMNND